MNNVVLALIVGLLAGGVGAYGVHALTAESSSSEGPVSATADLSAVIDRLDRIEAALEREGPMTLRGTDDGGGLSDADREAVASAVVRQIGAELKGTVKEGVQEAVSEMGATTIPESMATEIPRARARKKATIREAAAEMGLSSTEENELRQIYDDTIEKAIDLIAGENGDRDEVRRDFEALKRDPSTQMAMMGKYMPKVLPKIGEFMTLEMTRRSRIVEAIGAEKADQLQRDYDLEEAGPLSGGLRFEARSGMPR